MDHSSPDDQIEQMFPHLRFIKRVVIGSVIVVAVVYLALWGAIYLLQDRIMFPLGALPEPTDALRHPSTVELTIPLDGGGTVVAWFIPAPGASRRRPAPVVMYFHGNAELIDEQFAHGILQLYREMGCSILLPEYRGYGRSGGTPSQVMIRKDCIAFYDEIAKRPDVDRSRIIYHGQSLGGAVAVDLATVRPPRAMVLQSTFSSTTDMVSGVLTPRFLFRNPYRSDQAVLSMRFPIVLFHGTRDEVIPIEHSRRLKALAPQSWLITYDAGHNDFPGNANQRDYWRKMIEFLVQTGTIAPPRVTRRRPPAKAAPTSQPAATAPPSATTQPAAASQPAPTTQPESARQPTPISASQPATTPPPVMTSQPQ